MIFAVLDVSFNSDKTYKIICINYQALLSTSERIFLDCCGFLLGVHGKC